MLYVEIGSFIYTLGVTEEVFALFSTICVRLEDGKWGSRFPLMMNGLFNAGVKAEDSEALLAEVEEIIEGLKRFTAKAVIWDIDDLSFESSFIREPRNRSSIYYYFDNGRRKPMMKVIKNVVRKNIEYRYYMKLRHLTPPKGQTWTEEFRADKDAFRSREVKYVESMF